VDVDGVDMGVVDMGVVDMGVVDMGVVKEGVSFLPNKKSKNPPLNFLRLWLYLPGIIY
jgi:hypothetical protein